MTSAAGGGLRCTTHRDSETAMLTPTVNELPRALEPLGPDPFLAGPETTAAPAAPTRIGLAAPERNAGGAGAMARALAA